MVPRRRTLLLMCLVCLCPILYVILIHDDALYRVPADELSEEDCSQQRVFDHLGGPAVKRVLLISHGRSGSTFVSYILKEVPDTFFFFEPLRATLLRSTRGSAGVIMRYEDLGGTIFEPEERPLPNLTTYEQRAVTLLDQLLGCDIGNFPVNDYISRHFLQHGNVSKVTRCLVTMLNETYLNLSHYLQCLLDFWHSCRQASLRLFKVIRLPVRAVFSLMRKYPDLRVVYLVRDPRATLNSQNALFGKAPHPGDFCRMVVDDAAHMKLMQESFPRRVVAVRYEDIAQEPFTYTRRLYHALDLPLTPRVEINIRKMTSASTQLQATKDHYSAYRSDSRKAANEWRTKITSTSVRKDDSVCEAAYEWLGYRAAGDLNVLRNLTLSLIEPTHRLSFL